MKRTSDATLRSVQAVYEGAEGDLWELIMGQQIHIGGLRSSMDLAERAGVGQGMSGIDLCCCNGAGMRFLVRFRGVSRMHGVDATEKVVRRGIERSEREGLAEKIRFTVADATDSGLPDGCADFIWGEDAWCYVVDKDKLIEEAARLVKSGGRITFTDWVEGETPMSDAEAERFGCFMKFPNVESIAGYAALLGKHGCRVEVAEPTGRFAPYVDLYLAMIDQQLTYDALGIIGWDMDTLQAIGEEMRFIQKLAHAGKVAQGLFIARKETSSRGS